MKEHRKKQRELAIARDMGACQYCYRLGGKFRNAEEVHHVFGRGKSVDDWREKYQNLLSTCRKHHPSGTSRNHGDGVSEHVLEMANKYPLGNLTVWRLWHE